MHSYRAPEIHHTPYAKVSRYPSQTLDGIVLIHEHEAADDRVKRVIELHGSRIPDDKSDVGMVAANCTRSGPLHCCRRSIRPQDVSALAHKVSCQKAYIPAAATDIEDPHARFYSCLG